MFKVIDVINNQKKRVLGSLLKIFYGGAGELGVHYRL